MIGTNRNRPRDVVARVAATLALPDPDRPQRIESCANYDLVVERSKRVIAPFAPAHDERLPQRTDETYCG